jgi:hypothetical protein
MTVAVYALRTTPSSARGNARGLSMNQVIYIVGLIVVVLAIASFFGLH